MFRNKNIIFLTHSYANFQKDQIEIISKNFKKVYVLVRHKPIAGISNFLPYSYAKNHTFKSKFDLTNKPENVTVIPVPLWYLPFDLFYKHLGNYHLLVVERLIKKHNIKFNIIHSHFIWTAGYVGVKLHEKCNVPVIITGHGGDVYDYPFRNEFWKGKTFKILSSADAIITVSQRNSSCLRKIGIQKNLYVIPNGFSHALFFSKSKDDCRLKLGLPQDRKIIISVGSLGIVKGHKYLIDAIEIVAKKVSNVLCFIIGDGELRQSLLKQIDSLELRNNIRLLGRIQHNELVDWYNSADLFVLPSLSESFGVVQIEAMACGKPVVATRNGGSEEVVANEDVGYLCEAENPIDLAAKIEMALKKNWDRKKIISFAQKFSWEYAMQETLNIYSKFLI